MTIYNIPKVIIVAYPLAVTSAIRQTLNVLIYFFLIEMFSRIWILLQVLLLGHFLRKID